MMILTWRKKKHLQFAQYWRGCINGLGIYHITRRTATSGFETRGCAGEGVLQTLAAAKEQAYFHACRTWVRAESGVDLQ